MMEAHCFLLVVDEVIGALSPMIPAGTQTGQRHLVEGRLGG